MSREPLVREFLDLVLRIARSVRGYDNEGYIVISYGDLELYHNALSVLETVTTAIYEGIDSIANTAELKLRRWIDVVVREPSTIVDIMTNNRIKDPRTVSIDDATDFFVRNIVNIFVDMDLKAEPSDGSEIISVPLPFVTEDMIDRIVNEVRRGRISNFMVCKALTCICYRRCPDTLSDMSGTMITVVKKMISVVDWIANKVFTAVKGRIMNSIARETDELVLKKALLTAELTPWVIPDSIRLYRVIGRIHPTIEKVVDMGRLNLEEMFI